VNDNISGRVNSTLNQRNDSQMKIYLDNCCFNRPFDDQSHLRIRLEAEAKLRIQEEIRSGSLKLIWSYILDYESSRNPFLERRAQIEKWRMYAVDDVVENASLLSLARQIHDQGIKRLDALHIACAIDGGADQFLSTDDGILKKGALIKGVRITDPIGFIKEVLP